ncbi:MAG: hypothetical protein ISS47_06615 [Candidatus Omnitrophica bacterium]|nr:hypothetical protein [Candidatus Omnitrophota bacterium]
MKGLDIYKTKSGFRVIKLHYTADPDKDPDRNGQNWLLKALQGVPGGKTSPAWRKEMEIDFTAYSGQLLCYDIIQRYRHKIIVEKPIKDIDHRYGSLDWGRNNPASFHVYTVDEKKNIHSAYEVYKRDMSIPDFCKLIKASPHYHDLKWISADPSIWNNTQETKLGLRSLADMFMDESVYMQRGKSREDILAINELLDRWNNLDENEPRFTISPKCHMQIWEFERLRYKELTTAMIDKANPHEQLVDKENHSFDDYKYFISTWLSSPAQETPRMKLSDWKMTVAYEEEEIERGKNDWRRKHRRKESLDDYW